MKKLLFLISFAVGFLFSSHLTGQNHFSTKIGEVVNGVPTITYDQNTLKQEWQSFLSSNSGITVSFSTVGIYQEGSMYLLRGSNSGNTFNSAIELVLDQNDFYQLQALDGGGTTCTCSGCPVGCSPKYDTTISEWWCTPCIYPWTSNDCTKTVTTSSFPIFGDDRN